MAIGSKLKNRSSADTYMALIERLPLKPTKDDHQHEAAVAMIAE